MKILVVGTGSIGRRHIRIIKATGKHEVIVCDVNRESVKEVVAEYDIAEYYYDYKEALKTNVDAVIVCTPNSHHSDVCIDALASKCNVLVEKPLAQNKEEGKKITDAAKKTGKVLMVGYILRFCPGFGDVKKILDEEIVGKPVCARVELSASNTLVYGKSDYRHSYKTGGGIIYDYSHEIDYLRHYFGEPKRYTCFKDLTVQKDYTCDDLAEIIIQFECGVMATVHMDYIQECGEKSNKRTIEIICEKGNIRFDFNGNLSVQHNNGTKSSTNYPVLRDELFLEQLDCFERACNGEPVNYVSSEDGLAVLEVCDRLYVADKENIVIQV